VKILKYAKIVIPLLLVLVLVLFLHKNLMRTSVVQITGTDVKRTDTVGKVPKSTAKNGNDAVLRTSDVRFINVVSKNGRVKVFRNEDTGWGWPPYFKFDSADVAAQAQAYSTAEPKPWVLVKYYGWRIKYFSMFPNVLSLQVVQQDHTHFPLFNIVIIAVLLLLAFLARRQVNRLIEWMRGGKK
jgi:hypothetical protein